MNRSHARSCTHSTPLPISSYIHARLRVCDYDKHQLSHAQHASCYLTLSVIRSARMSTATLQGRGVEDTAMVAPSINNKIEKIRVPRFKRRGSKLRRDALERLQQGKEAETAVADGNVGDSHGEGKHAVDGRDTVVGDIQVQQRPMDGTMSRAAIDPRPPQRKGK